MMRPDREASDRERPPFYRSLAFRIGLFMGLLTLTAILAFAYFSINAYRNDMMARAKEDAHGLSESVVRALKHSMKWHDAAGLYDLAETVSGQKGILSIRVYNHAGELRLNYPRKPEGSEDTEAPGCHACHAEGRPVQEAEASGRTRVYHSPEGDRVLGMITPIHNETSCSYTICHARPDQQRILGILDVGISLKEADLSVRSALQKTLLFAIGVFLGTSVILIGALAILVGNPIGKIVKATQRISHGEYGERIETRSRGELGELAQSFNLMSEQVEERARQLQRSREQFQTLFENVPSYIAVVDRSYRIVEANRNFRDVFGKWEGEHCFRAYKGLSSKCEYCPVELTFQDSQPHRSEEKGVTKSGDEIHYLVYTAPVFDDHGRVIYSIEMSVDLREKRRLAKALRVSLEYLNNLVENSIHGIVAADAGGHVMIYNRAAERLLGYTPAEVLGGTDLERLFPEHFAQNVQEVLQEKGEVGSIAESHEETWVWAKGGERIPIRFSGLLLMEDGLPVGAVGFFQDLRPLKAMEQEKQQAERLAVVGQTVAALAHGIKNIIQGLEGGVYVTQTAMKRREEPLLEKGWSMMQRNIEKISLLVKDLLSFSKVRVAEMESVQPNELAEEVRTLFQENAGLAGIDLVMELDPSAGHAWLDPKAVHTCLANLLSNAIDACTEDKEKEHHRVVVRTRKRDDGAITFEVEDDGIGMEEATRERLFTNFFSTKGTKGTGLGLMVTQKLVHEHGGRVSVVTEVGRGSLFRITIPQRESGASIQERCEILAQ